jgi:serine/threonine-protein kinase
MFILEQFIDGPSLKQLLDKQIKKNNKPLSITDTLVFLKAVSASLGYAHSYSVVHCDVKPGNVMIDRGGDIYLTDFGIVRHEESTTTTIGMAGAPAYMSPEQILGKPVTPASDIYSLGIMLYEMLAGRRPFTGTDIDSTSGGATAADRVRTAHLQAAAPDPREFNPEIPGDLAGVVLRALSKDPEDRYHSTAEFLDAACVAAGTLPGEVPDRIQLPLLTEIFDGQETSANQVPMANILGKRGWLVGAGGVFLVSIVLVAGVALRPKLVPQPTETPTLTATFTFISIPPTATATSTTAPTITPTNTPEPTSAPISLPSATDYPTEPPPPTSPPEPSQVTFQIQNASSGTLYIYYADGTYLGPVSRGQTVYAYALDWGSVSLKICKRAGSGCNVRSFTIGPTNWLIVLTG